MIQFIAEGGTMTLPAPEPGTQGRTCWVQAVVRMGSAREVILDGGALASRKTLLLAGLTSEQRGALESFFQNTVRGRMEPFQYCDSMGVTHAVRFAESELVWESPAANVHDVRLVLECCLA